MLVSTNVYLSLELAELLGRKKVTCTDRVQQALTPLPTSTERDGNSEAIELSEEWYHHDKMIFIS